MLLIYVHSCRQEQSETHVIDVYRRFIVLTAKEKVTNVEWEESSSISNHLDC